MPIRVSEVVPSTASGVVATDVAFTPADTISATNVQAAVVEALTDARAYADTGDGLAVHLAGTETITGAKTFSIAPVAPGVTAPASTAATVQSPLGAGSSDVCAVTGSSMADGSVSAGAKLLSVQTGIGGTPVEKLSVNKAGDITSASGKFTNGAGALNINAGVGAELAYSTNNRITCAGTSTLLYGGNANSYAYVLGLLQSRVAGINAGATDVCVVVGTSTADASVNAAAKLLSVRTAIGGTEVEKAFVLKDGTVEVTGVGVGLVLRSPDGTRYRVTVANGGTLVVAPA